MVTEEALGGRSSLVLCHWLEGINHLPAGAVSSSQHPLVTNDGATAPPTTAGAGEAESHLVGELSLGGSLAVGDATLNGGHGGQVTRMHGDIHWHDASGDTGQSQSKNYEHLHVDR